MPDDLFGDVTTAQIEAMKEYMRARGDYMELNGLCIDCGEPSNGFMRCIGCRLGPE